MKIAPGIHRIGNNSMINAYLVEQAGEVTIIDAGVSGLYKDITRELAAMGRTPADVRALVLTHGHTDHIGFAERLRRERRVRCRSTKPTPPWPAARCRTQQRATARSSSGPSWGSCGSAPCTAGCAPPSCSRSRPSAMAQPWTSRAARGSS